MTNLSPSAQAVLDAVKEISPAPADEIAAVALRAAALILQEAYANEVYPCHPDDFLLDLAAELEGYHTSEND